MKWKDLVETHWEFELFNLEKWLRESVPGETIVYHIGSHATGAVRDLAQRSWLNGKTLLFQKKIAVDIYEYRALRVSEKN